MMLVDVFKKHSHNKVTVNEMTSKIWLTVDCVCGDRGCSSVTLSIQEEVDYTGCEMSWTVHYQI